MVTGVVPSPPRFLPSIFIAHRIQQSHCSSIFHRVLLTRRCRARYASQFVHKKKYLPVTRKGYGGGGVLLQIRNAPEHVLATSIELETPKKNSLLEMCIFHVSTRCSRDLSAGKRCGMMLLEHLGNHWMDRERTVLSRENKGQTDRRTL